MIKNENLWDFEVFQNLLISSDILLENKEKIRFEILSWVLMNEEINVSTKQVKSKLMFLSNVWEVMIRGK